MRQFIKGVGTYFVKYCLMFLLMLIGWIGFMSIEHIKADTYQDFTGNAEDFYDTYTDKKMVFFPTDAVDGKIYFGSRGKTAASTAGTKFREIGWQFVFTNKKTGEKGIIYYKRGGMFVKEPEDLRVKSSDGYTYTMYYIKLSELRSRLSSNWEQAFLDGNVELVVNSVMTITVNGSIKGSMDDYGNFSGKVYTTLEGIRGAAAWSEAAKESLSSYFGKTIDGLFHTVKIINGTGIQSTSGAGTYLYGTKVPVKSTPQVGYQWNADRNSKWVSTDNTFSSKRQNPFYTVGSRDVTLVVQASKNKYTICYQDGGTVSTKTQAYWYGDTASLATLASSGLSLGEDYTYDSSKTWAVVRKSDNAIYASGWKTGWENGGIAQSAWSKYKEGFSFSFNHVWINTAGNPHGDDTFYFYLQKEKKPIPSVTVVFHKNYPGQTDSTYTETYKEGVANQRFGMKLGASDAGFVKWNLSPEGYYLPGDSAHGGGWSENKSDTKGAYGLTDKVEDAWIRQMNGNTIHLYMIRPPEKLTVVFHKNYKGQTDSTYSETYTYGVSGQSFGMKLAAEDAGFVKWNSSPTGYYLPADATYGGGWAKDKDSYTRDYGLTSSVSNAFISEYADQGTLHIYMVRPPKKIQVVFHKNDGGTATYSETYTYGVTGQYFGMNLSTADAYFLNWKRSGYTGILGWAKTAGATEKNYGTSEKVADAWIVSNEPKIDLYAVWGSSVQITVNPNGGVWEGSEKLQQFTLQKGEILSLPYPSREGYTFVGWTWNGNTGEGTRSSVNGWTQAEEAQTGTQASVSYNSSDTYTSYTYQSDTPVETNAWNRLTVGNYAITEGHTYRISGRIRINTDAPVGVMVYHGEKANDYMNFKGTFYGNRNWQTFSYDRTFSSSGTGWFEIVTDNWNGKSGTLKIDLEDLMVLDVTAGTYMVIDQINSPLTNAQNLAVTAHWKGKEVSYQVYHNLMNVSGEGYTLWKTEAKKGIAGSSVSVSDVVLSPEGFSQPYKMTVDGQSVSSTTIKGDGSTKIYLYYTRNQYQVILNAGTGILGTTINGTSKQKAYVFYGAEVTAGAKLKDGYAWDKAAKWSGTYTSSAQNYTFTMPAKNVTLTADASIIYYKITYYLDGGSVSGNPDTYTVEDTFTLNDPAKTGHRFGGWTGSNGKIPYTMVTVKKGTTGDLTYYANWELEEFYLSISGFLNGLDYDTNHVDFLYDQKRAKDMAVFDLSIKKPGETDYTKAVSGGTVFNKKLPYGTQWKIENITPKEYSGWYYVYNGVKGKEKGNGTGSLSGTISADTYQHLVFTSYHQIKIGAYCDGKQKESLSGYGSFDVKVSGKNALGTAVTASGSDVTVWDKYYPMGSSITISDVKKSAVNINNGTFADVTYNGLYHNDSWRLPGTLETTKTQYTLTLLQEEEYLLSFTSWYHVKVSGLLDGEPSESTYGYGTFDVNVDGETEGEDVILWNKIYPYGTGISIEDVKPLPGHAFVKADGETDASLTSHMNLVLEFKKNQYQIVFHSNGEKGTMPSLTIDGFSVTTLPKNQFYTTNPATFMGWLDAKNASQAKYAYEWRFTDEEVITVDKMKELITDGGYQDGDTITLYAIWDYAPQLEAYDRYISVEFANDGGMTEEELFRTVTASDKEDGAIAPGIHEKNSLVLVNYSPQDYLNWSGKGSISETYRVTDSAGNVVEKMITVHLVDTTARKAPSEYQRTRFISQKYADLSLTEEEGGLAADSIWRTPEYYAVLSHAVNNKRINQEEVEIRFSFFTTKVIRPGSGEWLYPPEQVWVMSHEDILAMKQYVKDHGPGNFYEEDALSNFYEQFKYCIVESNCDWDDIP